MEQPIARLVGVLAALACPLPFARAQGRVVELAVERCEQADATTVAKLAAIELAAQGLYLATRAGTEADLRVSLTCAAGAARIDVDRAGERLTVELALADTSSEARPRLLALAIAELVATSRLEQSPEAPPATPPPESKRAEPTRGATIWVAGGLARAWSPARFLPLVAAGGAYEGRRWSMALDLTFEWTGRETTSAHTRGQLASLAAAPALALRRPRFAAEVGAGVRVGWAWLRANPRTEEFSGRSLAGSCVAPVVQGAIKVALTRGLRMRIGLELGYVVKGVRGRGADGEVLVALEGLRASASLGLGYVL